MSLHLISIAIFLLLDVFVLVSVVAFGVQQMPTPRMRVYRHARFAHR